MTSRQKQPMSLPQRVQRGQGEESSETTPRLWGQLTPSHRQQVAQCLAGLIWRMQRQPPWGEEDHDEQP